LLDEEREPDEREIARTVGKKAAKAWNDIREFLDAHYDFQPETIFYGRKYGWTIRYRRSGKTLCSLFPETGAFTVLIILGKKEVEKAMTQLDDFSREAGRVIIETPQLHDGKWLWIRLSDMSIAEDIKKLISIKRRPKKA